MQGKFKLVVLHGVGHSVQEDDYKGTARMLYDFLKDFRIPTTLSEVSQKQLVGIANFHPDLPHYWCSIKAIRVTILRELKLINNFFKLSFDFN